MAIVLCLATGRATGDWPQFRGPNQDGLSPETGLLRSWPEGGPKVLWTVPVGLGYGGPAIRDGQVYLLDRVENAQNVLRCLDLATGEERWRYAYDAPGRLSHNGSRATPTVDEKYVYSIGPFGHIYCIDRTSHKPLWSKNLLADFGGRMPRWGVAQSPVVYGDALIVAPLSEKAGIVALSKTTGAELWRSPALGGLAYVSPRLVKLAGVDQILIISADRQSGGAGGGGERGRRGGAGRPAGVDPRARGQRPERPATQPSRPMPDFMRRVSNRVAAVAAADGRLLWSYEKWRCLNPIPNPVPVGDDRVFITGGYGAGSVMLKVWSAEGRFSAEPVFTLVDYGSQIPNPLLHAGHLYVLCNGNFRHDGLVCIDLEGNMKWQTGREPNLDRGHTLIAEGLMYSIEKLLCGKEIWAPMALADGKLLIRDQHQMKCLDVRAAPPRE